MTKFVGKNTWWIEVTSRHWNKMQLGKRFFLLFMTPSGKPSAIHSQKPYKQEQKTLPNNPVNHLPHPTPCSNSIIGDFHFGP